MAIFREFFLILLLSAVGAAFSLYHGWAPLPWVEPKLAAGEIRLVDAQALDVIWLDTRPVYAFESGHIPDALFFDEADWDSSLMGLMEAWLSEPRPIVVYCGSENCGTSQRVAGRLRGALPDAEIYSLKGGWDAWAN